MAINAVATRSQNYSSATQIKVINIDAFKAKKLFKAKFGAALPCRCVARLKMGARLWLD